MDDLPLLVEHFLARFNRDLRKNVAEVSSDALDLLTQYPWPGNVRELQSVLKQALLQTTGPVLLSDFLPNEFRGGSRPVLGDPASRDFHSIFPVSFVDDRLHAGSNGLYSESIAYVERILLARVLRYTECNQSRAAKILGIALRCLRSKIRLLGITINQAVNAQDEASADDRNTPAPGGSACTRDDSHGARDLQDRVVREVLVRCWPAKSRRRWLNSCSQFLFRAESNSGDIHVIINVIG